MTRQRVHSVIVDLAGDDLAYQSMCREGDTVPPLATFRKPAHLSQVRALSEGLSCALSARSGSKDAGIRDWGGRLYDQLIPADLAAKLQSDGAESYLVLYLDPELIWIPWELLWDGNGFLCLRHRVARLLQKTANELRAADRRLSHERSGRGALIICGDITGLSAGGEKADIEQALGELYRSNIWFCKSRNAGDLLELLKQDYDICHFIGHGRYVPESPEKTGWVLADGAALTCQDIEGVSSQATFPLLIFANSCDSAHSSFLEHEGYVSTLYRAFLRQGVPHYIGTVSPVSDVLSREFAAGFWRLLAEGASVGDALGKTRQASAEKYPIPVWASYVHYGDPTYRLVRSADARVDDGRFRPFRDASRGETAFSTLGRASQQEIQRIMNHYKAAITANPADEDAHYALGICYLQLGLYDLAIKNFQRTIEIMPAHADAYYYLALAFIRGRRPKTLSLSEVRLMEKNLTTAIQLDSRQAKYYYLAAILKVDYYLANGLVVPDPPPELLFELAERAEHDPWEVERMLHSVLLRDPQLISRIRRNDQMYAG